MLLLREKRACDTGRQKAGQGASDQGLYSKGGQIRPALRSKSSNSTNLNANGHEIGKSAKSEGGKEDGTGAQSIDLHIGKLNVGKEFRSEDLNPYQLTDIQNLPSIYPNKPCDRSE